MSTMEHLFMQIFDRKQWIEVQLKHQVESYGESLAYNMLAEGQHPPPWLWTTQADGFGYPDPKGFNTEQFISGMLFPLPQTTIPSAINSAYFTVPAFMGNKVSQSNKFTETCASNKHIFTEHRYKAVPNASKVSPDSMGEPKVVEACADFAPSAMIQHCGPRQRDQEIHLDEREKGTNHLGERSSKEAFTGRLSQSKALPVKADNVRESSAMNDSLHHQHTDGGRVTRSRSRSVVQPNSLDKSSDSLKTLNCIEDDVYKGAEVQTETKSVPSVNLNHLPCTTTTTSNVRVSHTCTTRRAEMEIGLDTTSHENSRLKMSRDVAPLLPDTLPLVVPKKLNFEGMEENGLNRDSCISSEKINQLSSKNSFTHSEDVQPGNKDFLHIDPKEVDDSEKDVLRHKMEVDVRVSNCGTEQDGVELLEVDEMESHSHPTSDPKEVGDSEKDVLQHKMEVDVTVSDCGTKQDEELLEVDETESHSHPTSGHQSFLQDVNRKSSLGIVAEEQHSIRAKEVLMMGVDYRPPEIYSLVESKCPAPDGHKKSDSNINAVAAPEETNGSSSDIAFDKLKDLLSGKEAPTGGRLQAHVSSIISQLQEAVLPTVEVVFEADEANIVSGQVLSSKRLELSEALESESISLPGSHNRNSDISATSYLKTTSGTCECSPTCLFPDAEGIFNSDFDFADNQIFIPGDCKKTSLKSPVWCPAEEKNRAATVQERSSSPIQLMNIVQNAGSTLTSQMDKALEADTAALGVVKSILQPTVIPTMAGTQDTILEFRHRLRYSSNGDKKLGLSGYALPFSDNVAVCLPALSKGKGSTMGIKELSVTKISSPARTHNAQIKVPYSFRSSTRLTENLGSYLANGSVSCSKENSTLSETNKNEISASLEDDTEKPVNHKWITPNNTETQGAPTKARYFLRSLSSQDKDVDSSRSSTSTYATCLKQAKETISHACEVTWPKRRKVEYRSTNILATSPRLRFNHSQRINKGSNCNYKIESGSVLEFQPTSILAETKPGILNTAPETSSKSLHQRKKRNAIEGYYFLKENGNSVLTSLPSEHTQKELLCDIADSKSQSYLRDETKVSEATICARKKHYILEGCHDSLLEMSKSPYNSAEFTQDRELCAAEMSSHMHDAAISPHYDSVRASYDQIMPEFEGFSIDFPSIMEDDTISNDSKLPTLAKERVSLLEQLYKSRNVLTPLSCTSSKYKIHKVPDVYQSLPGGLLEHMNLSCSLQFNDRDMQQFRESDNGNVGLQLDGSFVGRPYSYSMPSSSTRIDGEVRKPPLTPPVVKFSQKVVSGQSGGSSEKVATNPELVCFRIDENSSIPDENGHADQFDTSEDEISLRECKELTNRKALVDITAEYQDEPILVSKPTKFLDRGSLESINSESYFRIKMSAQSSLTKGYADHTDSKIEDKENTDVTVNKNLVRKAALSLRNRSSKPRLSGKINERSRSHGNLEKGHKPSNIVSNISSFVPLVHQKQQAAAPSKGRKDIKVKALEAAEAAKRLEEKKQNEREMRKAAAKLEREKLEQENIRRLELKQKQKEEERKKKEADIQARKRQREEEGRKEKERKRRCVEETRKQKREQEEKSHAEKVEKEPRKEELGEEVKRQLESEKGAEVVQSQTAAGMQRNNTKVLTVDDSDSNILEAPQCTQKSNFVEKAVCKSNSLQEVLQTRISTNKERKTSQSYEMSPYKDSDDEDGEEEIRREKKCIPLWARRECLDQIVLSKRHIDPTKIFSRKHSFIMSEVLSTRILRRPF